MEGLRLKKYRDSGGVWTIGYGHTGQGVNLGEITIPVAESLLQTDINEAAAKVNRFIQANRLRINQNQFDALTAFVFNLGNVPSKFVAAIKSGNQAVKSLLYQYRHDNGVEIDHLKKRRLIEGKWYAEPYITDIALSLLLGYLGYRYYLANAPKG